MLIAIFGCGQLAQMTAKAGQALNLDFSFIAEAGEDTRCVEGLGNIVVYREDMSAEALYEALGQPKIITVEKEMVDSKLLADLQNFTNVCPNSNALRITQNRIREKQFIQKRGIETAKFVIVKSVPQLRELPAYFGFPLYIKAAETGYDGYNQWRITSMNSLMQEPLIQAVESGVELIAEKHVPYLREISVIATRDWEGKTVIYPIMENNHRDGVLISTLAPAPELGSELKRLAHMYIENLMQEMDYIGTFTMECFETEDGLIVNELAPRVHNSGHWTIEGSETSQFENHCRAISGMELGPATPKGVCGLVNMLGSHGDKNQYQGDGVYYHAYGKEERPRRKLGHITVCTDDYDRTQAELSKICQQLYP